MDSLFDGLEFRHHIAVFWALFTARFDGGIDAADA
jgi:hypothetical protein